MTSDRPVIRAFPRADRVFQREVDRLFAGWFEVNQGAAPESAAAFEAVLQAEFPSASVRPQDPLATFGPSAVVWYVHRREMPVPAPPTAAAGSRPGSAPTYSAARVAEMVGVPMSVLVGWDERDGLVRPYRTAGGLALYSRNEVETLLEIKRQVAAGRSSDELRAAMEAGWAISRDETARRLLVLLAERDAYAAEFSEYFLRTEGYEVEVALNAAEAEARAAELRPDLSIVELLISGGAGAELCARLKSTPGAVVLAISGLDAGDQALRAGADAFLAKPYDALALVSIVKDLLGESAMLRRAGELSAEGGA